MFSSKSAQVLLHCTSWLLFFGLVLSSAAINKNNSVADILSPPFLLFYFTYLFIFYLNERLLIPRLYLQKKYFPYFVLIGCFLLGVALLQPFDKIVKGQRESVGAFQPGAFPPDHPSWERQLPGPKPRESEHQRIDIVSIILFITVWVVSIATTLFRKWSQTERRAVQAEVDKAHAELSFLKAQVNPHFLFNTLNNIYSLTLEKSDQAPAAVMKLSNIMRYVTDEAKNDFVPLADEVACISDYINLQELRISNKTEVRFTTSGSFVGLEIAPLILMPFVENVFKHGISNHNSSIITIAIQAEEKRLQFVTRNKIFSRPISDQERTGVGITNTRQRLQHLYPDKHTLLLSDENQEFLVQLFIELER